MSMSLEDLSRKMKEIDFAMLATHSGGGAIGSRPMSNNRRLDYGGSAWLFTEETTLMVSDIKADPAVNLSYQGK
jgi:general stress protein 26